MAHTGFRVVYDNGEIIEEKNDFFDENLQKTCATNWHQVDQDRIAILEIWWNGEKKAHFDKKDLERVFGSWVFYHTGSYDSTGKQRILSRSIGFRNPEVNFIVTVNEETGFLS